MIPAPPGEPHRARSTSAAAILEQALAQADVAHLARRKPVCTPLAGGGMRLAWEKRFLSIAELAASLLPQQSPQADPWLFRRLTRTLDRRMLALLAHPEELRLAAPFSLNLNVASIMSPHFTRFDTALPGRLRGEVVLDLLPADIMGDLTASWRRAIWRKGVATACCCAESPPSCCRSCRSVPSASTCCSCAGRPGCSI